MIIYDLKYLEEVVAETPSIVGGNTTTTTLAKLNPTFADLLAATGNKSLTTTQLTITSKDVSAPGTSAFVKKGKGKTKAGDEIKFSSAASLVKSK